ncbi:YybS family protein [Aneurinibacillus sp. Ricciae_BoGa-3]|uniref:YybS family protein n=1 Tax=Aneurinibacillus sp. Ricciae_BoGa-3 TaxID=3022697 RepID=UPI00233FC61B|nr:YybS family protein [Aneurinibacillus sp. Ricciae_BoGa-3]WCK54506.1 YybS family protein [Aneurinibacillus sp. Ricciae_BoGa-3]
MRYNLRTLLEGAYMSAISLVLFLIAFYTPISVAAVFALPVPLTIYGYRHSLRACLLAGLVTLILTLIFGNVSGLTISLPGIVLGLTMGISYRRGKSAVQALIVGTIVSLALFLLSLGVSNVLLHIDPIQLLFDQMKQTVQMMRNQVNNYMNILPPTQGTQSSPEMAKQWNMRLDQMLQQINMMMNVLPAMFILASFISALVNHALSRHIAKRIGQPIPALPPLRDLRFSRSILYYYFIAMLIMRIPGLSQIHFLNTAALNVFALLTILFYIEAAALFSFFRNRKGLSKGLWIVFLLLFLLQPFTYILILLGMIDVGFNLRSRFFGK